MLHHGGNDGADGFGGFPDAPAVLNAFLFGIFRVKRRVAVGVDVIALRHKLVMIVGKIVHHGTQVGCEAVQLGKRPIAGRELSVALGIAEEKVGQGFFHVLRRIHESLEIMLDQPLQVSGNLGGVHILAGRHAIMPAGRVLVKAGQRHRSLQLRLRNQKAFAVCQRFQWQRLQKEQRGKCRGQESLEHVLPHFTFHSSLESTEESVTIS